VHKIRVLANAEVELVAEAAAAKVTPPDVTGAFADELAAETPVKNSAAVATIDVDDRPPALATTLTSAVADPLAPDDALADAVSSGAATTTAKLELVALAEALKPIPPDVTGAFALEIACVVQVINVAAVTSALVVLVELAAGASRGEPTTAAPACEVALPAAVSAKAALANATVADVAEAFALKFTGVVTVGAVTVDEALDVATAVGVIVGTARTDADDVDVAAALAVSATGAVTVASVWVLPAACIASAVEAVASTVVTDVADALALTATGFVTVGAVTVADAVAVAVLVAARAIRAATAALVWLTAFETGPSNDGAVISTAD
jgi:hypothetical protein